MDLATIETEGAALLADAQAAWPKIQALADFIEPFLPAEDQLLIKGTEAVINYTPKLYADLKNLLADLQAATAAFKSANTATTPAT